MRPHWLMTPSVFALLVFLAFLLASFALSAGALRRLRRSRQRSTAPIVLGGHVAAAMEVEKERLAKANAGPSPLPDELYPKHAKAHSLRALDELAVDAEIRRAVANFAAQNQKERA